MSGLAAAGVSVTQQAFCPEEYIRSVVDGQPAPIAAGKLFPDVKLKFAPDKPFSTRMELLGKVAVIFTVPKAFTPVCTEQHLPGFILAADKLRALGVHMIICVTVNTKEELAAWDRDTVLDLREKGKWTSPEKRSSIIYWADPMAKLIREFGLCVDKADPRDLGLVAERAVIITKDGFVKARIIEESAAVCKTTSAESVYTVVADLLGVKVPKGEDEKKS